MNATAMLSELLDSMEFDSEDFTSCYDRQTGRIVTIERSALNAVESDAADLSAWDDETVAQARAIRDDWGKRFIRPPDKFDFHEYHQMERFIRTVENDRAAEELWRAIKGKGAFRYFKDTADRLELLDDWYRFRDEAARQFVLRWAEAHEVPVAAGRPAGAEK